MNINYSFFGNLGPTGFSYIARDSNGNMVFVMSGLLDICDSMQAEVCSFLEGLRMLKDRRLCLVTLLKVIRAQQ